jgi:hypothetical protein
MANNPETGEKKILLPWEEVRRLQVLRGQAQDEVRWAQRPDSGEDPDALQEKHRAKLNYLLRTSPLNGDVVVRGKNFKLQPTGNRRMSQRRVVEQDAIGRPVVKGIEFTLTPTSPRKHRR